MVQVCGISLNIIFFCRKIDALKDTVILRPKELINAMRAVIRCFTMIAMIFCLPFQSSLKGHFLITSLSYKA